MGLAACGPVFPEQRAERPPPGLCVGEGDGLLVIRDADLRPTSIAEYGDGGQLLWRHDTVWSDDGPISRAEDWDGDGIAEVETTWKYADGLPIDEVVAVDPSLDSYGTGIALHTAREWVAGRLVAERFDTSGDGTVETERLYRYLLDDRLAGYDVLADRAVSLSVERLYPDDTFDHVETHRAPDGTVTAVHVRTYDGPYPVEDVWEYPVIGASGVEAWRWDAGGRLVGEWRESPDWSTAVQRTPGPRGLPIRIVSQADAAGDGIWEIVAQYELAWSCGVGVADEAPPDPLPIP